MDRPVVRGAAEWMWTITSELVNEVYAESKLANIYYAQVLAEGLSETGVTVNALNPGYVATQLGQPRFEDLAIAMLVVDPELTEVTGTYFDKGPIGELSAIATDRDSARRLWDESERLVAAEQRRDQGPRPPPAAVNRS